MSDTPITNKQASLVRISRHGEVSVVPTKLSEHFEKKHRAATQKCRELAFKLVERAALIESLVDAIKVLLSDGNDFRAIMRAQDALKAAERN